MHIKQGANHHCFIQGGVVDMNTVRKVRAGDDTVTDGYQGANHHCYPGNLGW